MSTLQPGVFVVQARSWLDLPQPTPNTPLAVLPTPQADRLPSRDFDGYAARIRNHIACRVVAIRDAELRLGRVLAWLKRMDLAPFGWPEFTAFCLENVELSLTRVRQLIRLAEADLPEVHAALRRGDITLSAAMRAMSVTTREDEARWLDAYRRGMHRVPKGEPVLTHTDPADIEAVHASRNLARLLTGRRYSDAQADRFVREAFEVGDPSAVLEHARTPPPPPPPLAPLPDDPTSVDDALARLAALQQELRLGEVWLGDLYDLVREQHLVWAMGFDTLGQLARWLGYGRRTLEEYAVLAQNVALHPELGHALARGMPMQKVRLIADIVEETTAVDWVVLAERTTTVELTRAKQWAEAEGSKAVLRAYAEARDRVAAAEEGATGEARSAVAAAEEGAEGEARDRVAAEEGAEGEARDAVAASSEATSEEARDRVAIRQSQRPEPTPLAVHVSALQVRAARWFVAHVRLPPRQGCGKAVERDDFVCQNPRCGKRCSRNHAHHVRFRWLGGSDDPSNLITLCPGCHLRGVHAGRISVVRLPDGWLWRFVDGDRVFVLDRPAPA